MAQVNYVREMESFRVYAEANRLTASERLVWTGIFHLMNARAFASEWPDGYIEIRRADLIAAAGVSKNTVLRAREGLAKRGLIDYTIGGRDGGSRYKMLYLSVYGAPVERESVAAQGEPSRETVAADSQGSSATSGTGRKATATAQMQRLTNRRFVNPATRDDLAQIEDLKQVAGDSRRGTARYGYVASPSHGGTTPGKGAQREPSRETVAADSRRYGYAATLSQDGTAQSHDGTTQSHDGTTPSHDETTKTGDVVTTEYINPTVNIELNIEDEDIYNNKPTARARAGEWGLKDEGDGSGRLPPLRNNAVSGRGGEETALQRAFAELIGRRASPVEVRDITEIAAWCRAEDALILEAIKRAGQAGALSAGKYVTTCLMRWSDQDIRTAEELETWERLDELSRSARPDIAARGEEKLSAFCRELKIKHGVVNAI